MKILTISHPSDTHAHAVNWALQKNEIEANFIYFGDYPERMTSTYFADDGVINLSGPQSKSATTEYDVIWHRRRAAPIVSSAVHEADRAFAIARGGDYLNGILDIIGQCGFWINPLTASARSERKLSQYEFAKQSGILFPKTIISNDINDIMEFISSVPGAITKPLNIMYWHDGHRFTAKALTSRIREEDVLNDAVRPCPMIYQEEIIKKYEVRVVVFGREVVAVRLDTQMKRGAELDWRGVPIHAVTHTPMDLPEEIVGRILKFMAFSGLVHGSFDFAVDQEDRFIFFEVNQQGQFLWLEDICPDLRLLDRMVEFMKSKSVDFTYTQNANPIRMEEYMSSPIGFAALEGVRGMHAEDPKRFSSAE